MPVYIGVDDLKDTATSDHLEQGYIIAESDARLRILYTFLKKNKNQKIMVFFSSCMSVKFHYEVRFWSLYLKTLINAQIGKNGPSDENLKNAVLYAKNGVKC